MTVDGSKLCPTYDLASTLRCRHYAGHRGSHNFARLAHDCALECELRRELDETLAALTEALDLFDASWCPEYGHAPNAEVLARVAELRKRVQP